MDKAQWNGLWSHFQDMGYMLNEIMKEPDVPEWLKKFSDQFDVASMAADRVIEEWPDEEESDVL